MATVDDKKIIFSMVGVSKIIPQNQKQILKNIYLSFFYGAKIGIIGLNGAGKSTLMKIIAGLVEPTQGEVVWSPGIRWAIYHRTHRSMRVKQSKRTSWRECNKSMTHSKSMTIST